MARGLKGKTGLSKEQRQLLFCTESRLCSQKTSSRDEAIRLCSLPKPPKTPKARTMAKGKSCEKETEQLGQCVMNYFEKNNIYDQILNVNSVEIAILNALMECRCPNQQ